jgi:hypothetical protein
MQCSAVQFLCKESITGDGAEQIQIPRGLFRDLLIIALQTKGDFDEEYYLKTNPDVRRAIDRKQIINATEHYYQTGYFENRLPKKILIDNDFYLKMNSDVSAAINAGTVKAAQDHFETAGFREGRLPFPGFRLF